MTDVLAVPIVHYGLPSDITSTTATLNGSVTDGAVAEAWFVYKKDGDPDYSATTPATDSTEFAATLTGLTPASRYTYIIAVRNESGTGGCGLYQDFTTTS